MKTLLVVFLFILPLYAQVQWERAYGGANDDIGFAVAETHDGFVITGITNSYGHGDYDLYLLKINSQGDTMWTAVFGGSDYDAGECVIETPDHGILAAGLTYSYGAGNSDVFIVKTDSAGNFLWQKTYGGSIADEVYSIVRTPSGYLLAGRTYSFGAGNFDVYVLAIDENGDTLWTRTYGGTITDGANSIIPVNDGGYLLIGYTYSYGHGNYDVYVLKIDSTGNPLWQSFLGGSDDDVGTDAVQTPDGGFLVAGYSYTFTNGADDFYLVKIDSVGNFEWQRHFGGSSSERAYKIERLPRNNYIIGGYSSSSGHGGSDVYMVAVNSSGNPIWNTTIGGSSDDGLRALMMTSSGDLILAGYTESYGHGNADVYAVRFYSPVGINENTKISGPGMFVFGNPDGVYRIILNLNAGSRASLELINPTGRVVKRIFNGFLDAGKYELQFSTDNINSGVYFLVFKSSGSTLVQRIWIIK